MNKTSVYLIVFVFTLATACAIVGKIRTTPIERMERMVFDWHYSHKQPPGETSEVILILGGEQSFSELGAWPWPRQTHAKLLGLLGLSRTVMLDIIMPEKRIESQDMLLAQVIKTMGNVVVAGHVTSTAEENILIFPYEEMYRSAAEFGVTNVNKDVDGILRSHMPFRVTRQQNVASLPLANASLLTGGVPQFIDGRRAKLQIGDRLIPLSETGEVWVQFPEERLVQYEYTDVLNGSVDPETFRNKIVIVGVAASGASDFYSVPSFPGSKIISGAEYNARALISLLWSEIPVRVSSWITAIICFFAVFAGAWFVRFSPIWAYSGLGFVLIVISGLAHVCFIYTSIWIDLVIPLISIVLSFSATLGLRFALIHRDWEIQSQSIDSITTVDIQTVSQYDNFSAYLETIWEKLNLPHQLQLVGASIAEKDLDPHLMPEGNKLKIKLPGPKQMKKGMAVPISGSAGNREFVLLGWNGFIEKSTLRTLSAVILSNAWFFKSYKEAAKRKDILLKTINAIFLALDFRDPITGGHSNRVSSLTLELLKYLIEQRLVDQKQADAMEDIYLGALVHDVGKIGIPDTILLKTEKLTKEEHDRIKSHPVIGHDIMKTAGLPQTSINVLLQHHERYNGKGYPKGLEGEDISFGARVVAVIDVYDALTNDRPYRRGLTEKKTCEYLRLKRGVDFDPDIVDAFLELKDFR